MSRRAQFAVLAAVLLILAIYALWPTPAASDAPVAAPRIPAGEFGPTLGAAHLRGVPPVSGTPEPSAEMWAARSAGPLSGQATPGAPFQPRTLPVVGSPPILEKPAPSPSASKRVPTPTPVRTSAPETVASASKAGHSIRGSASWFRSPRGVSAAGPALRRALGPGWRGTRVRVTGPAGSATTTLGDWMRANRLIDLDDDVFPAVCGPLSRGICKAKVTW